MKKVSQSKYLSVLNKIVKTVVGFSEANVLEWEEKELVGGLSLPRPRHLYGTIDVKGRTAFWSCVAKSVYTDSPEYLIYQSGMMADWESSLRAAKCYMISEGESGPWGNKEKVGEGDKRKWLWMEDVQDDTEKKWTAEQFGKAAQHLGRFQGEFLIGKRTIPGSLKLQTFPMWRLLEEILAEDSLVLNPHTWKLPIIQNNFDIRSYERLRKIAKKSHHLRKKVENFPFTLCHGDYHRGNLFFQRRQDGSWQTVAVDWESASLGWAGQDLAPMLTGNFYNAHKPLVEFERRILDDYLNGLSGAGWLGSAEEVYLAYALATLVRTHLSLFFSQFSSSDGGQSWAEVVLGISVSELATQVAARLEFSLERLERVI